MQQTERRTYNMTEETRRKLAEAGRNGAHKRTESITAQVEAAKELTRPIELVQIDDCKFDPILFTNLPLGEQTLDAFFSNEGGLPKATNLIIIGDPGAGKTTIALDIAAQVMKSGDEVLFVSAEMQRRNMKKYTERFSKFGKIKTLFLSEYDDQNTYTVLTEALKPGYALVIFDSLKEIFDTMRGCTGNMTSQSEKWISSLMAKHNRGENESATYTTFFCIQQVNKSGESVGTNSLKHALGGTFEVRKEGNLNFMRFEKYREGETDRKLYFDFKGDDGVRYNQKRWELDSKAREAEEMLENGKPAEEEGFKNLFQINEEGMVAVDPPDNITSGEFVPLNGEDGKLEGLELPEEGVSEEEES